MLNDKPGLSPVDWSKNDQKAVKLLQCVRLLRKISIAAN